jgi:fucose permease
VAPGTATLVLACYWASLMAGRIMAAPLLRRFTKPQMIMGSTVGAVVGCALLVTGKTTPMFALAAVVIGLSFAPIFTCALGLAGDRYPQSVGSVFGMLFAVALAGGMLSPWAVGQIAQHYEAMYGGAAVRFGMFVPLVGAVCIGAIAFGGLRVRREMAKHGTAK